MLHTCFTKCFPEYWCSTAFRYTFSICCIHQVLFVFIVHLLPPHTTMAKTNPVINPRHNDSTNPCIGKDRSNGIERQQMTIRVKTIFKPRFIIGASGSFLFSMVIYPSPSRIFLGMFRLCGDLRVF